MKHMPCRLVVQMAIGAAAAMAPLLLPTPALAGQDLRAVQEIQTPPAVVASEVGQTAQSSAGQIGQRQSRATAEKTVGVVPLARIENRVPNRVQSRVRNRIDRYYDPRANAASPFAVAGERIREATGPRRR